MTQQAATIQPDTTSSTKHPRPRASPHTSVANKTAKPSLDASASTATHKSTSHKTIKLAGTDAVVSQTATSSKASNKQAVLIGFMERPEGVSLDELMKVSGWQAHSVRGWISGTLSKKLGLVVTRFKSSSGETCYRTQPESAAYAASTTCAAC